MLRFLRPLTNALRKAPGAALLLVAMTFSTIPADALDKDSFFYLLDAQVLGGYSQIESGSGTVSSNDRWSVSPNLILAPDKLVWINLYEGFYNRTSQVIAQEEGGQKVEETMGQSFTTALKYDVTKNWALRPLFFMDWVWVNETKDESFGEGLYDYNDIGAGLESAWITFESKNRRDEVRAGFRYFEREYPNYQSLISQFDPRAQVTENQEKDFVGWKGNLSYERQTPDSWSWGAEAILLYKDFDDKRTIDQNGIRRIDDYREDYQEFINAYISHPIAKDWSWRLDGQVSANQSNLDLYDTHNTATLSDDDFIGEYYDYVAFLARPSITYSRETGKDMRAALSLAYSFSALYYNGRKAQDTAGKYLEDNEEDYTHTFSAELSVPLTKYVSWVTVANYTIAESNQDFEAFYLYTYDSWNVLSGFSFKY